MDVFEALQRRRTVRAFLDLPVPRETLEAILDAALRTPSWANTQPWEIYVAGGEALERVRATFVERTRAKVPGHPIWRCRAAGPRSVVPAPRRSPRAERAWPARPRMTQHSSTPSWRPTVASSTPPAWSICAWTGGSAHWSVYDLGAMAQSIMLAALEQGVDSAVAINLVVYPDVIRRS